MLLSTFKHGLYSKPLPLSSALLPSWVLPYTLAFLADELTEVRDQLPLSSVTSAQTTGGSLLTDSADLEDAGYLPRGITGGCEKTVKVLRELKVQSRVDLYFFLFTLFPELITDHCSYYSV